MERNNKIVHVIIRSFHKPRGVVDGDNRGAIGQSISGVPPFQFCPELLSFCNSWTSLS
jgi:hypothetical protein